MSAEQIMQHETVQKLSKAKSGDEVALLGSHLHVCQFFAERCSNRQSQTDCAADRRSNNVHVPTVPPRSRANNGQTQSTSAVAGFRKADECVEHPVSGFRWNPRALAAYRQDRQVGRTLYTKRKAATCRTSIFQAI